ncbi:MAG: proton-conducting transporter membrane subunit [Thermofilum sp.]
MWSNVENLYLLVAFSGVALTIALRLAPEKLNRPLSTAASALFMLALLALSISAGELPGYVGFVSFAIGLAAVLAGYDLVYEDKPLHDALTLALASSLPILAGTEDLIKAFAAWELMSVSVLLLVAFHREKESAEAALKYLMLCGAGTAVALAGIALVVLETGSTRVDSVFQASLLARMLLAAGFATEAAVFPLHFWLPDAHMVAPSTASAMLSGVVIEAAAILVYRLAGWDPVVSRIFLYLSVAGAFVGNLSALAQDDIKRMLAYSSVANVSYIVMGLCSGDGLARTYALLHVAAHGYLKASLFIVSGILLAQHGTRSLSRLTGALSGDNLLKLTVIASALGLTGAPPLLPFWSELFIAVGVLSVSPALPVLFALAVILSFGYYFRLLQSLSQGSSLSATHSKRYLLASTSALLLVALNALLFTAPSLLVDAFALSVP